MSGFKNWLSANLNGGNGGNGPVKLTGKKIIWFAIAVFFGIFLIIMGNFSGQAKNPESGIKPEPGKIQLNNSEQKNRMAKEEEELSAKLQQMLEGIEGSGKVKVTVRLANSAKELYALNKTVGSKSTLEKDQGGGTRTINENTDSAQLVIAKNADGDSPVVEMETSSQVSGVLIVAQGASDPKVKERLFEAAMISLNVDPHKILVLPAEGGVR
ncbi:MAG: hypothetical protein ACOY46_10735 [Bacillota bacterium]